MRVSWDVTVFFRRAIRIVTLRDDDEEYRFFPERHAHLRYCKKTSRRASLAPYFKVDEDACAVQHKWAFISQRFALPPGAFVGQH